MASNGLDNKKKRDNFSQSVLKILCARAGGKCCKCGANTMGPGANNPCHTIRIGQGAHIAAASPGGPRYDGTMSPEERSSVTNGLWLCHNCHDQVDKDPDTYPIYRLQAMKKEHELRMHQELGVSTNMTGESSSGDRSALIISISSVAILSIRRTKSQFLESLEGYGPHTPQAWRALSDIGFIDVLEDEYVEEVGQELVQLYRQIIAHCRDPEVMLEVIRRLKIISDRYHTHWDKAQVQLVCDVTMQAMAHTPNTRRSMVFQSCMALLMDICKYPALRNASLHYIPQQIIRKTAIFTDQVDAGIISEPETDEMHLTEEEEQYLKLLEELLDTTDLEKTVQIELKMQELGYTPYVQ